MKIPDIWIIEGIDRCSKSTLVDSLCNYLGPHVVIHSGSPKSTHRYRMPLHLHDDDEIVDENASYSDWQSKVLYQHDYFANALKLCSIKGTKIIFDRLHLGEMVYSPLYRNVIPHSIMEMERKLLLNCDNVRLVLMTEDFSISNHFESDGNSFNDNNRKKEQEMFLNAFEQSSIQDKRIITVTADDGGFKDSKDIFLEAVF